MGFFDRNLDEGEGLMRVAAGFVAMSVGLLAFVMHPVGIVVCAVGLAAFAEGYYRWSLRRALSGGGR